MAGKYRYFASYTRVDGPFSGPSFHRGFFEVDQDVWRYPLGLQILEEAIGKSELSSDRKWSGYVSLLHFVPDPNNPNPAE